MPRALASICAACCLLAVSPALARATAPPFTSGVLPSAPGGPFDDAEPGIAASGSGTFVIGSTSNGRGADVWTSHDGGLTYQWAADPFQNPPGVENGEDTDAAAAPVANGTASPNLYAVSLYTADSALAVSHDDGKTFELNLLGGIPSEDRPWIAADGPCTVYLAYQNGDSGPPSKEMISRFDACQTPQLTGRGAVLNPSQGPTDPYPLGAFLAGKIAVDSSPRSPFQHRVYLPVGGCETDLPGPSFVPSTDPFDCQFARATLSIAVSSDGGQSFAVHRVADSTTHQLQVWPDELAVDAAGEIYLAWSDNRRVYLSTSTDAGSTWSAPHIVNRPPARSAVFPTVAAGATDHVDIAWYGTERDGASNDTSAMGAPGSPGAAPWRVYFAKSTDGGASFDQTVASAPVHTGIVCTSANACTTPNSRDLFEDFGIAISPTTQRASIAYTVDELTTKPASQSSDHILTGYATELPAGAGSPAPGCAARTRPRHARVARGRSTVVRVTLTNGRRGVRGATVRIHGPGFSRHARTNSRGQASFRLHARRAASAVVTSSYCGGTLRVSARSARRRVQPRFSG